MRSLALLLSAIAFGTAAPVPKELRGPAPGVVGKWVWAGGEKIPSCCMGTIEFRDTVADGRTALATRPDGTPVPEYRWSYGKERGTILFGTVPEVWTYKRDKGKLSLTRNNLTLDFTEAR